MKMKKKNIRIVKSAFILVLLSLAVLIVASSCDEDIINTKVPSWAIGHWSLNQKGNNNDELELGDIINQIEAVEITSKEFIPREDIGNISFLSTLLDKKEVTLVTNTTVYFDFISVEKGPSDQISVGMVGYGDVTLYRMNK